MKYFSIFIIVLVLLTSCISDEKKDGPKIEKLPEIALYNTQIILKSENAEDIVLDADYVEYLENVAIIEGMSFTQLDSNGALYLVGNASNGEINTDTKVMKLSGDVVLSQKKDDLNIECQELEFKYEDAIINTSGDAFLKYNNIEIEASSLSASLNDLSFEVGQIVKGKIHD